MEIISRSNDQDHIAGDAKRQKFFDTEHWELMINALHMENADKSYVPKTTERTVPSDQNTESLKPKAGAKQKGTAALEPQPKPNRQVGKRAA